MSFHPHTPDYSWIFEVCPAPFVFTYIKCAVQHDPCQYDTSMPDSSFVKYMREQDEVFFATFPDARRAAEEKKRLKALLLDHQTTDIPLHFDYQAPYPMVRPLFGFFFFGFFRFR